MDLQPVAVLPAQGLQRLRDRLPVRSLRGVTHGVMGRGLPVAGGTSTLGATLGATLGGDVPSGRLGIRRLRSRSPPCRVEGLGGW